MTDDHSNSASRMEAGDVARRSFGIVRRGFDPQEVRAYLDTVGKALEHADRREQELLHELQEAEERARHPVIDESVLTSSLGQRSAAVLRGAHEEAARILAQAEESATSMVHDAQQQATDVQVNAESSVAERIAEAELEANSLRQQARDEAAAVLEAAREEGEAVVERAREHGRSMLDQAQEARRRVLADMAHRRRMVTEQIEQFRAARDEIAGSVVGVRRSLDRIVEDLSRAEDAARAAASGAVRPHSVDASESVLVEEGERAIAELGELDAADVRVTRHAEHRDEGGTAHAENDGSEERSPRAVLRFDDIATVVEHSEQSVEESGAAPAMNGAEEERGAVSAVVARPAAEPRAGGPAVHDWQDDPALTAVKAAERTAADEVALVAPASEDPSAGGADVDGLFARLRASHLVDDAAEAAGGCTDAASAPGGLGDAAFQGPTDDAAFQGPTDDAVPDGDGSISPPDVLEVRIEQPEPEAEPSPDSAEFARRAETLDPIASTLARRLKRALQDDQNRLLDRLRQGTGEWSDELLLDEDAQRSSYTKAASESVRDAMSAGSAFARALIGGRQPKPAAPDPRAVDAVTDELASTIVTLIRRRLEGGEIPDAAERIGAAYREWRGERIERLAEDSAVEAFSSGVLTAAGKRSVRWSRSDVGPGCADCEDNALGGAVAPGDEFPTGHRHPPAHAGCRCLVLPDL